MGENPRVDAGILGLHVTLQGDAHPPKGISPKQMSGCPQPVTSGLILSNSQAQIHTLVPAATCLCLESWLLTTQPPPTVPHRGLPTPSLPPEGTRGVCPVGGAWNPRTYGSPVPRAALRAGVTLLPPRRHTGPCGRTEGQGDPSKVWGRLPRVLWGGPVFAVPTTQGPPARRLSKGDGGEHKSHEL